MALGFLSAKEALTDGPWAPAQGPLLCPLPGPGLRPGEPANFFTDNERLDFPCNL